MEINQQEATTCSHFSIRQYVSQMRNKDERVCIPFSMSKEKKSNLLPPLYVAKFKWYQCQACLDLDRNAMVPNINTSTNAEACHDGTIRDQNLEVITCPRSHSIVSNDQLKMIQANHEDEQDVSTSKRKEAKGIYGSSSKCDAIVMGSSHDGIRGMGLKIAAMACEKANVARGTEECINIDGKGKKHVVPSLELEEHYHQATNESEGVLADNNCCNQHLDLSGGRCIKNSKKRMRLLSDFFGPNESALEVDVRSHNVIQPNVAIDENPMKRCSGYKGKGKISQDEKLKSAKISCPTKITKEDKILRRGIKTPNMNVVIMDSGLKETASTRVDSQTGGSDRHVRYRYVRKGANKQRNKQVGLGLVPKFRDKIGSSQQMYTRRRGHRMRRNGIHIRESSTIYHEAIPIPDLNEKIPSNNTSPEHEMHNLISQVEDKSLPRHKQLDYPSTHNGDSTNDIRDGERALQLPSTCQGKRMMDFDLNCAYADPDDLDEHNNFGSFACEGWKIDLNREAPESP